jgi:hypothetical protein
MTDLSPAAQAVLADYSAAADFTFDQDYDYWRAKAALAAALRALANQVMPEDYTPSRTAFCPEADAFVDGKECRNADLRYQVLAIAAELENSNEPTFTPEEVEMIQAPWSYLQSQQELEGGQ